MNMTYP